MLRLHAALHAPDCIGMSHVVCCIVALYYLASCMLHVAGCQRAQRVRAFYDRSDAAARPRVVRRSAHVRAGCLVSSSTRWPSRRATSAWKRASCDSSTRCSIHRIGPTVWTTPPATVAHRHTRTHACTRNRPHPYLGGVGDASEERHKHLRLAPMHAPPSWLRAFTTAPSGG
jgi:hypothetical protein